jgi:hypothetical protein
MLHGMNYRFSPDARHAFIRHIALRKTQPLFSNARSIRNALDRVRCARPAASSPISTAC